MKKTLLASLITATLAAFAASPAMAEKKNDWTLSFPENKAHFVKVQMSWAKDNPDWKPKREELEAMFDAADADKDGVLTQEEWDSRGGKKAKKPKKQKKEKKQE